MLPSLITAKVLAISVTAAALGGLAMGFGAGWKANGWRLGTATAECRAQAAEATAGAASAALSEIQRSTEAMAAAAARVRQAGERSAKAQDEAAARWKALTKAQPLPPDCRPDPARIDAMREAIERAQREAMP